MHDLVTGGSGFVGAYVVRNLRRRGKIYAFYSYDDAGHSFFSVDRSVYRQAAAVVRMEKIFDWYDKYLR